MTKYIPRFNVKGNRPYVESANGPYINDIFDGTCASGTLVLGYTPEVFEKIKEEKMFMFSTLRFNHAVLDEVSFKLARRSLNNVYYCGNTGSDAVEAAVKVAFDRTGKTKIIARDGAFHGGTITANGLGNYPSWKQYVPLFSEDIIRIPFDPSIKTLSDLCAHDLQFIKSQKDIGGILIEPYPSIAFDCRYKFDNAGCYDELRDYCTSKNIVLIFDEIYTGAGKSGKYLFTEYLNIDPDLICLAKGITAGIVPLSILIGQEGVFDNFKHGITHAGHYLGVVATCKVYDEIEQLLPSVNQLSANYENQFNNTLGLMFSLDKTNYNESNRVFVNKSPVGDKISITPPLNITNTDMDFCIEQVMKKE